MCSRRNARIDKLDIAVVAGRHGDSGNARSRTDRWTYATARYRGVEFPPLGLRIGRVRLAESNVDVAAIGFHPGLLQRSARSP